MLELQSVTQCHEAFVVNFCLSYGSKGEIVQAAQSLCRKVQEGALQPEEVDETKFAAELLTASPDPDILIRTSGEYRLSNFLLWQVRALSLHPMFVIYLKGLR